MVSTNYPYLENSFQSVEQVVRALEQFEAWCIKHDDLRGVFATAYLQITKAISEQINRRTFNDSEWSAKYLIRFANLYREAILNYENKKLQIVPKPWRLAFDIAKGNDGYIIQHLLLGINAHINYDLALALKDVDIDPNRDEKYRDHNHINHILEKATNNLKQEVAVKYAPIFRRLDIATGNISDDIANFSIPKAREHAWAMAVALNGTRNELEYQILKKSLNEQAAVLSRLILSSPTRSTRLKSEVTKLKWLDQMLTRIKSILGL